VKKKLRRGSALLLVKFLILLTRVLPRKAGLALFSALGSAAYSLYGRDRERAKANLSLAFPDSDALIVESLAKGSFAALARNAYDALSLVHLSRSKILDLCGVDGEEYFEAACARGSGVIALTGHIGCWELMAAYFSNKGYKVSVIARNLHDVRLNDMLVRMRKRHNLVSIPRGTSAVSAYKVLRRGEVLGMLIDQDIDVDGVFVPFFGVPAYTPRGAAVFALRSNAAVVPMADHMQPGGKHRITVLPELEFPSDGLTEQERIDELTARCSEAVEKLIRIYPQQWVWFHDRWKKRPEGGSDVAGFETRYDGRAGLC